MRIVLANKYYFLKGGAERYLFDVEALLRKHGHETVPFAMHDARDVSTPWEKYFVSPVQTARVTASIGGLKTAGRMLYSFEAKRKFGQLLDAAKPDLVHVHNIYHQISPSILPEAVRRGLPVVMTAHDYNLVAPNYSLFHDGAICERTKPDKYWEAYRHRCVKGSKLASALAAFEMSLHRWLRLYRENVDMIVAPSRFVQALLGEYGVDAEKIVHVPHPIDLAGWTPVRGGDYALYVGRLSEEKGVDVLLHAAARRPDIPVRIVGTGPAEASLKALAVKLQLRNVEFVGWRSGDALHSLYAGSRFVVIPSVWYEVFGLAALEAYAAGKPVVASQIGGLGELVRDGETGFLTSAGDAADVAEKMGMLWDRPDVAASMGAIGRAWAEQDFTPDAHYAALADVYEKAKMRAHARHTK